VILNSHSVANYDVQCLSFVGLLLIGQLNSDMTSDRNVVRC